MSLIEIIQVGIFFLYLKYYAYLIYTPFGMNYH